MKTKKQLNSLVDVQKVLDALPFYVILVDEYHHILLANKSVQRDLDRDPESIVGGYCPKVVHGEDKPISQCPLEDAVREGRAIEKEYFDSQTDRWLSSAIYPTGFETKDGQPVYFHMVRDISDRIKAEQKMVQSLNKVRRILDASIQIITTIVEKRDPFTAGHQQHVSKLAYNIAGEMGLTEERAEGIRVAALVHDIGKIAVPIEILSKPGRISRDEMNIIKSHPRVGYNILKEIEFPWPVAEIVLQHHERLNGTGYPRGLTGKDILLEARIISVADVVEAMYAHRPYRPAPGIDKALEEISSEQGNLYDPQVVDICLKLFQAGFKFDE